MVMLIVMMTLIMVLVPSVRKCVCGKKRGQATSRRLILGDTSDELAVDNPVFDGEGEDDDDDIFKRLQDSGAAVMVMLTMRMRTIVMVVLHDDNIGDDAVR